MRDIILHPEIAVNNRTCNELFGIDFYLGNTNIITLQIHWLWFQLTILLLLFLENQLALYSHQHYQDFQQ
jgi:hypothetical protein